MKAVCSVSRYHSASFLDHPNGIFAPNCERCSSVSRPCPACARGSHLPSSGVSDLLQLQDGSRAFKEMLLLSQNLASKSACPQCTWSHACLALLFPDFKLSADGLFISLVFSAPAAGRVLLPLSPWALRACVRRAHRWWFDFMHRLRRGLALGFLMQLAFYRV